MTGTWQFCSLARRVECCLQGKQLRSGLLQAALIPASLENEPVSHLCITGNDSVQSKHTFDLQPPAFSSCMHLCCIHGYFALPLQSQLVPVSSAWGCYQHTSTHAITTTNSIPWVYGDMLHTEQACDQFAFA